MVMILSIIFHRSYCTNNPQNLLLKLSYFWFFSIYFETTYLIFTSSSIEFSCCINGIKNYEHKLMKSQILDPKISIDII